MNQDQDPTKHKPSIDFASDGPTVDPELIESAKGALSSHLHEGWREGVQAGFEANGEDSDTPRLRASKDKTGEQDEGWYQEQEAAGAVFDRDENGNRLVNTNVPYEELSPSWKDANVGAAEFVVDGTVAGIETGVDTQSPEAVEALASMIHDNWMKENSWQQDSTPELFVPYQDLPESEKAKDRDQVLLAQEALLSS